MSLTTEADPPAPHTNRVAFHAAENFVSVGLKALIDSGNSFRVSRWLEE